ncbi:hypothetical protein ACWIE7_14040 [Dietzia sp. NPDC055343]
MTTTQGEATDPGEMARRVFGWDGLRPPQAGAIEAAIAGRDVLAVLPTG